uniref:hypothetical protein n=1 Tax=Pseudomonas viridiflava TaxID=33069 RepID=UPI003C7A631D
VQNRGFAPNEIACLLENIAGYPRIRLFGLLVFGLMTVCGLLMPELSHAADLPDGFAKNVTGGW